MAGRGTLTAGTTQIETLVLYLSVRTQRASARLVVAHPGIQGDAVPRGLSQDTIQNESRGSDGLGAESGDAGLSSLNAPNLGSHLQMRTLNPNFNVNLMLVNGDEMR